VQPYCAATLRGKPSVKKGKGKVSAAALKAKLKPRTVELPRLRSTTRAVTNSEG
jgi:hypothetical protein